MIRKKGILARFTAALLILSLLPGIPAGAETSMDEVQARQEELRAENEALENRLAELQADESRLQEYQAALQEKIDLTERKVDESRAAIELMDREISLLEAKLELSRQEYQGTIDLFAQRLRALYMTGSMGTLEILLNSESFADFTMKSALISRVTKHDQELLDRIEDYLNDTSADREQVQQMREEEAALKKEQEEAQAELEGLYAENSAVIADLEAQQLWTRETIEANEEEDAELEAQLQELIRLKNEEEERRRREEEERLRQEAEAAAAAAANSGGGETAPAEVVYYPPEFTELGMHEGFSPCWPVPGSYTITTHYGDPDPGGAFHNGMDIAANYGTPIVAAQAGQVISAEYHWSWGNNILIWHNGSYATRYAHCSSMIVSPGQYVEQGEIIGYVGATGYAFGNHLHFEVYLNASRTAPEPYLGLW